MTEPLPKRSDYCNMPMPHACKTILASKIPNKVTNPTSNNDNEKHEFNTNCNWKLQRFQNSAQ